VSQNSLSLFDDPPPAKTAVAPAMARSARETQQRHLLAARRLARRMARFADQSPEQLQAGRQICRHLVAMLKEAETLPRPH
jgi:hypothetical protein